MLGQGRLRGGGLGWGTVKLMGVGVLVGARIGIGAKLSLLRVVLEGLLRYDFISCSFPSAK